MDRVCHDGVSHWLSMHVTCAGGATALEGPQRSDGGVPASPGPSAGSTGACNDGLSAECRPNLPDASNSQNRPPWEQTCRMVSLQVGTQHNNLLAQESERASLRRPKTRLRKTQ